MSMYPSFGEIPGAMAVAAIPPYRGRLYSEDGGYLSSARLSTDSIGNYTLTLTNVVAGSWVYIAVASTNTLLYDAQAASSTVVISLSAYASGNTNNDLIIRVRKATAAPKYFPYETFVTAFVGSASVFIAQVADTIAS